MSRRRFVLDQQADYPVARLCAQACFQTGTCPGATDPFIRWSYDGVGNRLSEARPGVATTSYAYDQMDRMLSAGATGYTYDRNGNELSAGSRTFTYDLANRLKTTAQSGTTTTYTYDGGGVRLQASTGTQASKKTNFLWDVNNGLPMMAREDNGNGQLQRRYVVGQRLVFMSTSANNAWYFHYDPLGSVRNVTSQTGATQLTYDYEPYGAIRSSSGTSPTNFVKFTGEYNDPTGLYHLRARQYDPASGRFLGVDPAQPASEASYTATYVYVDNRPMTRVDPSGRTFRSSNAGSLTARSVSNSSPSVIPGKTDQRCKDDPKKRTGASRERDGRIAFHVRYQCDFRISQYSIRWTASAPRDDMEESGSDPYTPNWGKRSLHWDHTLPDDFQPRQPFLVFGNIAIYPMWFRSLPFVSDFEIFIAFYPRG